MGFLAWLFEPSDLPGEDLRLGPRRSEARSARVQMVGKPPRFSAGETRPRLPTPPAGSVPLPADPQAPWKPEEVVGASRATELVESQFPALAPASVEPLGVGWDNTAFLVNGSHVFRFPRREIAVPLLAAEAALLPELSRALPLPVPVPSLVGQPSQRYRWPFLGYAVLPGRTACQLQLDQRQRTRLAEPLGRFLAALHAFPVTLATALGATGDTIGRLDLRTRVPRAAQMLASLKGAIDPILTQRVKLLIEESKAIEAPPARALVHGDLYARHLLLDEHTRLCGVIDWGDIHVGHPAVDLSVAHAFLPPEARAAFLQAYGRPVDPQSWRLARFRALFSALAILSYGREVGDGPLESEGRQALEHVVTDEAAPAPRPPAGKPTSVP